MATSSVPTLNMSSGWRDHQNRYVAVLFSFVIAVSAVAGCSRISTFCSVAHHTALASASTFGTTLDCRSQALDSYLRCLCYDDAANFFRPAVNRCLKSWHRPWCSSIDSKYFHIIFRGYAVCP